MLLIISPAKKLDFGKPSPCSEHSHPAMLEEAASLVDILRQKDSFQIADLMSLSMNLADLNVRRYQEWQTPFTTDNAKQAVFAFRGDVYQGMDADTLSEDSIHFSQQHLRILSGLYGLLRPLDLIQPYRLEMGTKLANPRGRDLYAHWGNCITDALNEAVSEQGDNILINLASNEYFKSVNVKKISANIITPQFKELRGDNYKVISFNAKKARGQMVRYIIEHQLSEPESLKNFNADGYVFNDSISEGNTWVFTR